MTDTELTSGAVNLNAPLHQPKNRRKWLNRFVFMSPQITILSIVAAAMLVALIVLVIVVTAQVQASATVLTNTDTNRSFVQLQRETLRLMVLVAKPIDEFKADDIQLQTDLIESRIGVIRFPASQAALPPTIQERATQIEQQWENIKPQIQAWKDDPSNTSLHETLNKSLTDFEFLANETEVNYTRVNTQNISSFARLNQQQFAGFAVLAVILVLFMFIVAISVYRFNQQRQEVEAVRETNRLKDEFLAVVSHELRTPLNAIIGFLGIMKMSSKLDERNLHMVERARSNATRLLALINDILDVSKIEAGKMELVEIPVTLRTLIEHWQSQMDVLAKQKGLEFNVHVDNDLPEKVLIDEDVVTKIATNLLSNAFKFTEKGSVSLNIKRGAANEWVISVADTGVGIPENAQTKIFESFRQVDSSIQRVYGGTGLGLSIVQRLCSVMGGTVAVESTIGVGSVFTVKLPLKPAPAPVAVLAQSEVAVPAQ